MQKLNAREVNALAEQIKADKQKDWDKKRDVLRAKIGKQVIEEGRKLFKQYMALPEFMRNKYNPIKTQKEVIDILIIRKMPKAPSFSYGQIERAITLSMIDAKDLADLIEKVKNYKF